MAVDYTNIDSIIEGFGKILNLSSVGTPPPIPAPLILTGVPKRSGISPTRIATRIISRKSEAGLPVGVLPSGSINPEEVMWRIAVEEIIKEIQENGIITVVIPPGISLTAAGTSPSGPVNVVGSTTTYSKGYAVIQ
jgi:hypothetical protein